MLHDEAKSMCIRTPAINCYSTCWFRNVLDVDGGERGPSSLLDGGGAKLLSHVEGERCGAHVEWDWWHNVSVSLFVLLGRLRNNNNQKSVS